MQLRSRLLAIALGVPVAAAAGCGGESESCGGPGVICSYMGTGLAGLGEDGVAPEDIFLYLPQDLTFGPDGQPYVLDWNNHRVRTVDQDNRVQTVIGTGYLGDAPDGPVLNASLNHPTHVSFSPEGKLMLSAWHNSKLIEVDLESDELHTICGDGSRAYRGDGGPAEEAWLDLPVASIFDSRGRLYVSDQANQRIRMIDENGIINSVVGPSADYLPDGLTRVCTTDPDNLDQTVCKNCLTAEAENPECVDQPIGRPQGFKGDGGLATEALIYLPFSQSAPPAGRIDVGPDDTLYITDTGNHRIRTVDAEGIIRTVAGTGGDYDPKYAGGYSGDGGPATEALLSRPTDIVVDPDGNYYIADTDNSCVRRVDAASGIITTAAGVCGQKGFDGDGGPAEKALLDRPYGVALDADGNLYIADTHNHRIRVVYAE
jgi:DNA-binding beta-propeller fold protein YncE